MLDVHRQALRNAYHLVAELKEGQTITRNDIVQALRKPLPPAGERESDAEIRHGYRHYIINAEVKRAMRVVTYAEAAALSGKSTQAIRQAAYRGAILRTTEYRDGWERTGVYLRSLADWCQWTPQQFQKCGRRLDAMREARNET